MRELDKFSTWHGHPFATAIECIDMAGGYRELETYVTVARGMLMVMLHHEEITQEQYEALKAELDAERGKGEVRQ